MRSEGAKLTWCKGVIENREKERKTVIFVLISDDSSMDITFYTIKAMNMDSSCKFTSNSSRNLYVEMSMKGSKVYLV